jgi:hypothetical protein
MFSYNMIMINKKRKNVEDTSSDGGNSPPGFDRLTPAGPELAEGGA